MWLNHHYEHHRQRVWQNCSKGGVPPARWIVNYDFDLLDGLVLGAVLGAHMPFLVRMLSNYLVYLIRPYKHTCSCKCTLSTFGLFTRRYNFAADDNFKFCRFFKNKKIRHDIS